MTVTNISIYISTINGIRNLLARVLTLEIFELRAMIVWIDSDCTHDMETDIQKLSRTGQPIWKTYMWYKFVLAYLQIQTLPLVMSISAGIQIVPEPGLY